MSCVEWVATAKQELWDSKVLPLSYVFKLMPTEYLSITNPSRAVSLACVYMPLYFYFLRGTYEMVGCARLSGSND